MAEDSLGQAERHVRKGEERVRRQTEILADLERDNHPRLAQEAKKVLAVLEETLRLSREHLHREQGERGAEPRTRAVHPKDEVRGGEEAPEE